MNETMIVLNEGTEDEWRGSFADFCAANEFEGIEIAQMEAALDRDGVFEGGGGAIAEFTLRLVRW